MAKVKLDSFAKINLYLAVRPRRRDNYHGITSVFERISLKDTLTLQSREDSLIRISTNIKELSRDSSNFVWQAAELLRKKFKITQGLNIRIFKRVPLGSGMGGGSSNAASALLGLNRLWELGLSERKLAQLGSKIGSDVPFFVYNCSFGLGTGRGEKMSRLPPIFGLIVWTASRFPFGAVDTPPYSPGIHMPGSVPPGWPGHLRAWWERPAAIRGAEHPPPAPRPAGSPSRCSPSR